MKNIYKNDIEELLEHSLQGIKSLNVDFTISRVQIKNILENLRSSLEYTAQYINTLLSEKRERLYFPYSDSEEVFLKNITQNFPVLETENNKIYKLIESLQSFNCNDSWLPDLCNATNIAKHAKALELESRNEIEEKFTGVSSGGINIIGGSLHNANIIFAGNYVNGKKADDFKIVNGQTTITNKGEVEVEFNFEIVENKIIIIKDIQQDLLSFLYKCHSNIYDFTEKVFEDDSSNI